MCVVVVRSIGRFKSSLIPLFAPRGRSTPFHYENLLSKFSPCSSRLHPHRVVGGHCDHCHFGGDVVPGDWRRQAEGGRGPGPGRDAEPRDGHRSLRDGLQRAVSRPGHFDRHQRRHVWLHRRWSDRGGYRHHHQFRCHSCAHGPGEIQQWRGHGQQGACAQPTPHFESECQYHQRCQLKWRRAGR